MPFDYWNDLSKKDKFKKGRGYFERMVTKPSDIPDNAVFIVRVAQMHPWSGFAKVYNNYEPNQIAYKEIKNITDTQIVSFLDSLSSC